jgi:hypothetical protein
MGRSLTILVFSSKSINFENDHLCVGSSTYQVVHSKFTQGPTEDLDLHLN